MTGTRRLTPLHDALHWLVSTIPPLGAEPTPLAQALHRILAQDTPLALTPDRPTATLSGIALRAATTDGATDSAPLPIQGTPVRPGTPMPPGTDAVLPDHLHDDGHAMSPIPPGHGVADPGHDILQGATLPAGTRLTPLHIACLAADPLVLRRPRIHAAPPYLRALLHGIGADPTVHRPQLVLQTTPLTVVAIPSLAIRPGETTELGHTDGTPAIRLPTHPVDAAAAVTLLVAPLVRHLTNQPTPTPVHAPLARKITSPLGQLDLVFIRLEHGVATPLPHALLPATHATHTLHIPEGSEGYPANATVPIYPL